MPIQDWGVTYAEMEPYHDLFEKLFGIAGKAGNLAARCRRAAIRSRRHGRTSIRRSRCRSPKPALIFRRQPESSATSRFPMPAANSPDAYTNPDGMQLGQCQYCGHCERFICEAKAKASPEVLLYPMLQKRKGFELRLQTHVLGVDYDRKAKRVTGVRYHRSA